MSVIIMKVHLGFLYIVSTIIFVHGQDSILPFLGSTRSKLDPFIKANRTRNTDINKRNELSLSYPFNFTEYIKLSNRENSLIHKIESKLILLIHYNIKNIKLISSQTQIISP